MRRPPELRVAHVPGAAAEVRLRVGLVLGALLVLVAVIVTVVVEVVEAAHVVDLFQSWLNL